MQKVFLGLRYGEPAARDEVRRLHAAGFAEAESRPLEDGFGSFGVFVLPATAALLSSTGWHPPDPPRTR